MIYILTTKESTPRNPFRQFIIFCTAITKKEEKTTYGFIYNAYLFEAWYQAKDENGNGINYNSTTFMLWEKNNYEGRTYFINHQYNNAYKWFYNILNDPKRNTGVRYGKLP